MNIRYTLKYTTLIQFQKARTHTQKGAESGESHKFIFENLCARLTVNELIRISNTLMPNTTLYAHTHTQSRSRTK